MTAAAAPRASAHDRDLATLAAGGDRQAFGELVRRHGSSVRTFLRRMGADPALADDLAQDALVAAFEQITDFRGDGAFAGWVKRIAARLYVRRWRRQARAQIAEAASNEPSSESPEEAGAADRIDLDEALRSLPPDERICVCLCYGGGFSHGEAAVALNAPLGTVKSHVKRGLDRLRRRLAPGRDFAPEEKRGHA
jgi:RNA polymerase sigma factor (sigma-70 family)